ncbi:Transmembrane and ubiquitin-like domain-containing protein 2 [Eumeta japonica]|uniref:Transmembrane and ubiquitin-like domain-containing protein 2 n=1 Tax=Eumeta variegata TaxID=151549 RepID=A0A4C1W990_EUMVA|nr:Transmembrane and ubiquitin-like domain-containing protein 2 [Eumeta japonica]
MTLIEGVGDEVTQFAAIVILVLVAALAWWSTNARPDRYRTVLVMRPRTHHRVISVHTPATNANVEESLESTPREPRVIPVQEMDSIVDADMAMMDHNRLHFYRRLDETSETGNETSSEESEAFEETELASNAQISEMESIVRAMEADIMNDSNSSSISQETTTETQTNPKPSKKPKPNNKASSNTPCNNTSNQVSNENNSSNIDDDRDLSQSGAPVEDKRKNPRTILIKLKYLNDTFKEVEGSLDELLKDFKWRHFSNELAAANRVRLIFNGRVLGDEAATLAALGLHHRAVVHCLVHPPRNNPQQRAVPEEATLSPPELVAEAPQPERSWDLENVLMTLVSIALTIVWFFRCEYSNMFTASASVALFGLTIFYSMAIFGLYLSDTFHVDRRRPPAPVPNQNQPASAN